MEHHFNVEVAKEIGMAAAVIYYNIKFWCEKNKANDVNYHDGYYWTFNSVKAFQKLFPYLSDKKISSSLKLLEDRGYIKSGNYNDSTYDRTKWYADIKTDIEDSNLQNGSFHLPKKENGDTQNGEPIPYINTYINTDNKLKDISPKVDISLEKENIKKKEKFDAIKVVELNEEISSDSELLQAWKDFIEFRKAVKPIKTMQGFTKLLNKLRDLSNGNHQVMIDILNQSIEKEWLGLFELEKKRTSYQPKQNDTFLDDLDRLARGEHIKGKSEFDGLR